MPEHDGIIIRLVAHVRALLPADWFGRAGERFRGTTVAISDFAEEHRVRPKDLLEDSVVLGRTKLEGLANKEYAEAAKNFAEAEHKSIEAELQWRSLESKIRREEAETRIAEIRSLDAEIELYRKLKAIGVVLRRDEKGNLTALPMPATCDLSELVTRSLLAAGSHAVRCPRPSCQSPDTALIAKETDSKQSDLDHEQWACNKCGKPFTGNRSRADESFTYLENVS